MWQSCKIIIVGHVTEQLVDSYAIMHAYKYAMCVYVSLISRPLAACLFSFNMLCTLLEIRLHAWPSLIAGLDCGLDCWTGLLDPTKPPVKAIMHV